MEPYNEPRVVTVIREHRARMEARELRLLEEMADQWIKIEQRVSGDMIALQMIMEQKAASGAGITQQMIWREQRYQILKGNLQDAIKEYNRGYLIPTVETAQKDFAWFGVEAASDAISSSYETAIAPNFAVLNREAVETMAGYLGNGAPLNTLLKNDYPDALDGLVEALLHGVARGSTSAQIGQEMANGLGMGLERALLIARTETARTYRSAMMQEYRESKVVTGFRRLVKKERACMACLMLDGERYETQEEMGDHPRGNCQVVPEVIGVGAPNWETGKDWFNRLDPEIQKQKLGDELYERWQKEKFDLSSMVSMKHSDVWGDSPSFGVAG